MLDKSKVKQVKKLLFIFETEKFLKSRKKVQNFFEGNPIMREMPYLGFVNYIHRWQDSYYQLEFGNVDDYRPSVGECFLLPFTTSLVLKKEKNPEGNYEIGHAGLLIRLGNNPQGVIQQNLDYWVDRTLRENWEGTETLQPNGSWKTTKPLDHSWSHLYPSLGVVSVNHPEFTPAVVQSAKNLGLEYKIINQ